MYINKKGIIILIFLNLVLLTTFLATHQYIAAIIIAISILLLIITLIWGGE